MYLILLGAIAVYLGVCAVLAHFYVQPIRYVPARPPDLGEVEVPTRYGPTPSWCTAGLTTGDSSPVVFVFAHGYGGTRRTWAGLMHDLRERGFDCLAMSMPGQDASPVKQVGFGIAEGHTIVDAVKWVRSRSKHAVKVVAVGVSMGGAGAWLASEEDPTIDGVVTESAFARFTPALKQFFDCKVRGMSVALSPMITIAKWMTALDPDGVLPVRAAEKWRGRPSLVIQAGDDVVITRDQGESLAAAAGCPLWIVPGAGHSQCYRVSGGPYVEHLVGFAKGLTG